VSAGSTTRWWPPASSIRPATAASLFVGGLTGADAKSLACGMGESVGLDAGSLAGLRAAEATAAVEALVAKLRDASEVRRFVAHAPLERPESGRVVEKAGFAMVREMDDTDEVGNVLRVKEWELTV
jgi:hypothetical protein